MFQEGGDGEKATEGGEDLRWGGEVGESSSREAGEGPTRVCVARTLVRGGGNGADLCEATGRLSSRPEGREERRMAVRA